MFDVRWPAGHHFRSAWVLNVQESCKCRFSGSLVQPQVVPAGGLEPFVPKNLLNVPNGAAIEQHQCGSRMPQGMGCERFVQTGFDSNPFEVAPQVVAPKTSPTILADEK